MLWLYIILGILLFILLILLIPIKVRASYANDFSLLLIIGFVRLRLYPPKPKKEKKAKKKKQKKPEEKSEKSEKEKTNLLKEKGLSWFVNLIKKVAELAIGVLKDFFKHIIIKKMMISIKVSGKDAADTAVQYGHYCSVVYPAVGTIARTTNCKKYGVDIAPDFDEDAKSEYRLEFEAKILVLWLIGIVFKHGIKGLKLLLELNKGE